MGWARRRLAYGPSRRISEQLEADRSDAHPQTTQCHVNPNGGGARNAFGTEIEDNFLDAPGAAGNVLWGPDLASIDSDGDGLSNGAELLDPAGDWSIGDPDPGDPAGVTHPSIFDEPPIPVPVSTPLGSGLLGGALLGMGALLARRRRTPA